MASLRALLALALLLGTSPAPAAWMEASSDHFLIYGNLAPDRLKAFAERLERFDQGMRKILRTGSERPSPNNRLTVYMVGDAAAVQKLCGGCGSVLGFYNPRASGSVAFTVTRAGGGSKFDINADVVLLHEYAHHLLMGAQGSSLPGWLNEGLAEFASTSKIKDDGSVEIGAVALHRAYDLMLMAQMPAASLLTADRRKLSPEERSQLYSRGWLLTHYLIFSQDRKAQLDTYIAARGKGQRDPEAGEAAFGDLKALDVELDRYKRQKSWTIATIAAASLRVGPVALRQLRPGEAGMMPYRIRSDRGVSSKTAGPLVVDARKRAAGYEDDPAVQGMLAEMEFDAGENALADAAADRALAADPKSMQALIYKGMIAMRRAAAKEKATAADWQEARNWLVKANRVEPDAAAPLMLYFDSFMAADQPPTENAKRGLERAAELVPQDPALRARLAFVYLRDGKLPEARAELATLAYNPHAEADNPAARLIAMIDEGKDKATIAAEADKLLKREEASE